MSLSAYGRDIKLHIWNTRFDFSGLQEERAIQDRQEQLTQEGFILNSVSCYNVEPPLISTIALRSADYQETVVNGMNGQKPNSTLGVQVTKEKDLEIYPKVIWLTIGWVHGLFAFGQRNTSKGCGEANMANMGAAASVWDRGVQGGALQPMERRELRLSSLRVTSPAGSDNGKGSYSRSSHQ
ncbi:hypothetical protein K438DRAFT_1935729 [Mycena galopus ATCC 62051]|nr:hypothetical protein K438DRAFT_1935729 [Mycena galopus ATCC 62051]